MRICGLLIYDNEDELCAADIESSLDEIQWLVQLEQQQLDTDRMQAQETNVFCELTTEGHWDGQIFSYSHT